MPGARHLFVSRDISQILRVMGFYEPCLALFNLYGKIKFTCLSSQGNPKKSSQLPANRSQYPAPTFNQALDWIRKEKGFHLTIDYDVDSRNYLFFARPLEPNNDVRWQQALETGPDYTTVLTKGMLNFLRMLHRNVAVV